MFFYYSELVLSLIRFWSFLESLTNWLIYYESEIWRIWRNMWIRNDVMVVYGLDYIGKWVSGSASFASFRIFYLVHRFLKNLLELFEPVFIGQTFISKDGLIGKSSESSNRSARGEFPGLIALIIRPFISFIGVYLKILIKTPKSSIHRKYRFIEKIDSSKISINRNFRFTE